MPVGRPPKPLERRALEARGDGVTARGRRALAGVIVPSAAVIPDAPTGLGERGETEWRSVWTAGQWLKPDQDYHWAEQVVRAYDDIEVFRAQVQAEGRIAKGSMGQVIAHPLIGEIRRCEDTIRRCLSTLGFSPTDRARLGLAEVKAQTALADLQGRTARSRDRKIRRAG